MLTATPTKLADGTWGALIILADTPYEGPDRAQPLDALQGAEIEIRTRRGRTWRTTVEAIEAAGDTAARVRTPQRDGVGGLTRRERLERRGDRRREWADSRRKRADADHGSAQTIADGIPMGQPILVGHHSEKRHQRDLGRMHGAMNRALESTQMASKHEQAADGIDRQLDRSIYSDDPDAAERLREKLDALEHRRERMKAINAWLARRVGGKRRIGYAHNRSEDAARKAAAALAACVEGLNLTRREQDDILSGIRHGDTLGYASYSLSNLGATIRRTRQRLDNLT